MSVARAGACASVECAGSEGEGLRADGRGPRPGEAWRRKEGDGGDARGIVEEARRREGAPQPAEARPGVSEPGTRKSPERGFPRSGLTKPDDGVDT